MSSASRSVSMLTDGIERCLARRSTAAVLLSKTTPQVDEVRWRRAKCRACPSSTDNHRCRPFAEPDAYGAFQRSGQTVACARSAGGRSSHHERPALQSGGEHWIPAPMETPISQSAASSASAAARRIGRAGRAGYRGRRAFLSAFCRFATDPSKLREDREIVERVLRPALNSASASRERRTKDTSDG